MSARRSSLDVHRLQRTVRPPARPLMAEAWQAPRGHSVGGARSTTPSWLLWTVSRGLTCMTTELQHATLRVRRVWVHDSPRVQPQAAPRACPFARLCVVHQSVPLVLSFVGALFSRRVEVEASRSVVPQQQQQCTETIAQAKAAGGASSRRRGCDARGSAQSDARGNAVCESRPRPRARLRVCGHKSCARVSGGTVNRPRADAARRHVGAQPPHGDRCCRRA